MSVLSSEILEGPDKPQLNRRQRIQDCSALIYECGEQILCVIAADLNLSSSSSMLLQHPQSGSA